MMKKLRAAGPQGAQKMMQEMMGCGGGGAPGGMDIGSMMKSMMGGGGGGGAPGGMDMASMMKNMMGGGGGGGGMPNMAQMQGEYITRSRR